MKRLFYLLLIFFAVGNICYANDIKFIQVTDVHLTKYNAEFLKQFVDEINESQLQNVDFIVFTGDNLDKANPKDLYLFLDIIKKLKPTVYVIPGNHDLYQSRGMTKDNYMRLVRKKLGRYHSNKSNFVIKKGDFVFITMNGVKEVIPGPNGYYKNEELVWLDKVLTKYADKRVIILQHFPLLETDISGHKLYKKEAYEEILNKHNNVISIISGHYHKNREEKIGSIYHIITKNFSNNNYYKIIKIFEGDDTIYTHLVNKSQSY